MRPEFPHAVVRQAYNQCGHRCECTNPNCNHKADEQGRCRQVLRWGAWEQAEDSADSWEPHHIDPSRPGTITNCQILCTDCGRQAATRPATVV